MLKAISLIAALVPFVLVGYFLIKLLEIKAREPSTTEPPTRQYELLQRYGYPSFVVIFSCIVLLGHLQPKWIVRMYFEPFLGFSLYLYVSSRVKSASTYFLLFITCAVIAAFIIQTTDNYESFQFFTKSQYGENDFFDAAYCLILIFITVCVIRFTLFKRFAISLAQIFISAVAIFFSMLFIFLTFWIIALLSGFASS